ncbi:helix-turn-helix domain-containing protein [Natrinema salaciae]|uniref:Predicted DNA binding protein, contains HTH domain n=1 Tax=Natrinema salaciae TaxID=1186196 RepID=A0A1H9JKT2_9EURY|nr:helix-turn-helix domain-containing protein [Natrinema salaciae]SEQ87409.1 Predicted DNA binding protein, contains HTH domain [Natrinema salaciae]
MKHIRGRVTIDPDAAPTFYNLLANSSRIREARLLSGNPTRDGVETLLFAIEGDPERFREDATETAGIESVELSSSEDGWTYAFVETRPLETPMYETIHRARMQSRLVARKPIVYRDGAIHFRVVGEPESLQAAFDRAGDVIELQIDEIETVRGDPDRPAGTLSERQREAVVAALELGYYDQPRAATHADVATELECAPATASEHLRKAEAKLVRAAMDGLGSHV